MLKKLGKYAKAERVLLHAAENTEHDCSALVRAAVLLALGDVRRKRGALADTRKAYDSVRSLLQAAHSEHDPAFLPLLRSEGELHLAAGDFGAARRAFEKAKRIAETSFGEHSTTYCDALSGAAAVEVAESKFTDAMSLLRRALDIVQRHGNESEELKIRLQIALVLKKNGKYRESIDMLNQHLCAAKRHFGCAHITTAEFLKVLGDNYRKLALFDKSDKFYELALKAYTSAVGDDCIEVSNVLLGM